MFIKLKQLINSPSEIFTIRNYVPKESFVPQNEEDIKNLFENLDNRTKEATVLIHSEEFKFLKAISEEYATIKNKEDKRTLIKTSTLYFEKESQAGIYSYSYDKIIGTPEEIMLQIEEYT